MPETLADFLDEVVRRVEVPAYIDSDPIRFVHAYAEPEDRLIAGFFAALFAWGRRDIVIRKTGELLERMGPSPAAFIRRYPEAGTTAFDGWKHRTFTADDAHWLCLGLRRGMEGCGSFEGLWRQAYHDSRTTGALLMHTFHRQFFGRMPEAPARVRKHLADNAKGSSCKRLYLFLRWTLRGGPVDARLMDFMPVAELHIPLDVHVGRWARYLGLLHRPQDDWKAVEELTARLRELDPRDPAKYDYALFGIGVLGLAVPPHLRP